MFKIIACFGHALHLFYAILITAIDLYIIFVKFSRLSKNCEKKNVILHIYKWNVKRILYSFFAKIFAADINYSVKHETPVLKTLHSNHENN